MSVAERVQQGIAELTEELSDMQQLRSLLSDLREEESEMAGHKKKIDELRDRISQIVNRTGTVSLPGLGRLSITAPAVTRSYDTQALDAIVRDLLQSHPDIAQRIGSTEKKGSRSGSLRIESEKPK